MKADDKIEFEGKKEKYTNFELLETKVEVMQEQIQLIFRTLKQNNLKCIEEVEPIDIDDEAFKRVEN